MTTIEWTRGPNGEKGETWNPIVGCSRVSAGCSNCYAERFAHRGLDPAHRGLTRMTSRGPAWTGEVRLLPERLETPLRWRKPRRVFVNSLSDLFHKSVPDEFVDKVFMSMALCPQHTFLVLTKRQDRMREWVSAEHPLPWPLPNVHLLVSVEDQATAEERIPELLRTPAAIRGVSYEPALGPVDLSRWLRVGIDHVIVGGESGPGARPCRLSWLRFAEEQCREARVPCFVKQLGSWPLVTRHEAAAMERGGIRIEWDDSGENIDARLVTHDRKGADPAEWPADLRVREYPR